MDNPMENWYAPREESVPPREDKKKRRLPLGWKIAFGTLALVALIAVSSLAFSGGKPTDIHAPEIAGDAMPENWQDFLDQYYTVEDSGKVTVNLPRAENVPDFTVEINSPGERELSLQELYKDCADTIVAITGYIDGSAGYYWGSGIILSEDGLILTNAHVIDGCDKVIVTLSDDQSLEAAVVGADATSDIAVLKIEAENLTPAEFGDSAALTVGDHVAAIGNPIGETFRMTLTDGIISAIDRGITFNGHSMTLIQTNTAINEGNSGGALFNMYGQVVGITNMKMKSSNIEGICFAIPGNIARTMANSIIRYGEVRGRTAVGITVGAIPDSIADHYELPTGLYVSSVADGSDAKDKGIREGDIVVAVNGEPARTSADILNAKNERVVGDTLTFTIWREGETFEVEVELVDFNDIY
ncbi:MAG: trypsin-like peptidase domain-containing protein [Oscillospiraceae bacterium]|nr:trypsin-like peptidase domain-containing protein [Oscillospiraceae bacterium]